MKSVLIAIQPYYVFLIIAHLMGWNIPENKTVEVRKNFPQDLTWDKVAHIYCSKNRKSFNRIPAKYQPLMARFLGKVIGKFVCDNIRKGRAGNTVQAYYHNNPDETCLTDQELVLYATCGKPLYFWHITNLTVYETPKELGTFVNCSKDCKNCADHWLSDSYATPTYVCLQRKYIKRPPQSWCYGRAV